MGVSSLQVSSTHASWGRLLRRLEIPLSGELVGCGFATRLFAVGLAAAIFTLVAAVFLDLTVATLGAAVVLGSDFLGLAVFLVAVTFGCLGACVTG
jgi:hypothetical protein